MIDIIAGINWGDEGKGRIVDMLCGSYDITARYQGGNNAGHTVVNERGKFVLNLLPSGIFHENVVNVMGGGMAIDLEHLCGEIARLKSAGIKIDEGNLMISSDAVICTPYHKLLDELEEDRLGNMKFGSTRRGIAPVYADKYMKKALKMRDLLEGGIAEKVERLVEWKNLTIRSGYKNNSITAEKITDWLKVFGAPLLGFIRETGAYLEKAADAGKKILMEAQLGALRDIDFGIYPYTTSSSTIAAYAPIGAGIPRYKPDVVIGVMKAYSSCVGEGPFTADLDGAEGGDLRAAGFEYGAATGRPRRVGAFDVPASRYGVKVQGADYTALTKLDVLSYMDTIPVCEAYEVDGEITREFIRGDRLMRAKPVIKRLPGFKTDISGCRKKAALPKAAREYISYIEEQTECPIKYVSTGPERDACIEM